MVELVEVIHEPASCCSQYNPFAKPVGFWSISCLVSLLGDFLFCLVLAGRLNSSGLPLLHVILSLEDMVQH